MLCAGGGRQVSWACAAGRDLSMSKEAGLWNGWYSSNQKSGGGCLWKSYGPRCPADAAVLKRPGHKVPLVGEKPHKHDISCHEQQSTWAHQAPPLGRHPCHGESDMAEGGHPYIFLLTPCQHHGLKRIPGHWGPQKSGTQLPTDCEGGLEPYR